MFSNVDSESSSRLVSILATFLIKNLVFVGELDTVYKFSWNENKKDNPWHWKDFEAIV